MMAITEIIMIIQSVEELKDHRVGDRNMRQRRDGIH